VLRFHLDENVDPAIAAGLRQRGVDATTSADALLLEATDEAHLLFALEQGRVIVTHDDDFLKLASRGAAHSGIAFCHAEAHSIGEIVRYLNLMAECLLPEDMAGKIEFF
jgi:predicted nuclease of predicted toxin-antitoxin system